MNRFDGLLSLSDAAKKYGVDDSVLRHAIRNGTLIEGVDVKKFGKQWVITEEALIRRYGL